MPGIKTRRGEIQEQKKVVCETCGEERKGVILFVQNKKMCTQCKCGVFNKLGKLVHPFVEA